MNQNGSMQNPGEFFRYAVLGGGSFLLGILLTWLLHEQFTLSEQISVAISLTFLFVFNFFMAREVVFNAPDGLIRQACRFVIVSLSMRLTEYGLFLFFFQGLDAFYLLAYASSTLIVFFVKFVLYKHIVFKPDAWRR